MTKRASEIRIGDRIVLHGVTEQVIGITEYDNGVMLFLGSATMSPFVSSMYASFRENAKIEVV